MTLDSGGTIALNALNGSAVLQGGQLTNVDNLIGGAGYIGNGLTLTNEAAGVIDANSANRTLTVDTAGDLVNDGTLEADGGTLFVADNVTGGGHATVAGGGTIHFAGDFQEDVTFQGGGTPDGGLVGFSSTLAGSLNVMAVGGIAGTIQFSTAYSGTISGFAEGDVIDLSYLNYGGGGQAVLGDGNILHITAGGGTADLQLDPNESFAGKDFQLAPDTGTGTEIIIFRPSDTTPPVLSSVADQTDEATGPSGAVATFAATATDDFDGTDEVVFREGNTVVHSGDTFSLGTHTITASAADSAGNTASENFTITVQDTAAPTLTPVADQTIEAASPTGAAATFSATATDPVDGTDAVVFKEGTAVVHSGDTFSIGTHIVTASATDAAGNTASETFTITVQDTTAPTLTPVANQTQEATSAAGAAAAFSASASDIVDGTDAVVFKEGAAVVHSGDTFSIGSHIVTASATDAAGNTAPETFTITVQDTTAPTLTPVADQTDEATSSTGASVTFSASATDIVDGTDTVVFKEGNAIVHSGDTFALGTHTITASATDTHGNSASETFTITVQDTTAPTLTPVANQTDEATSGTGAAATFSASATDIVDGTDTVVFKEGNAIVHSGDTFGIGTHTITANATDAHGNSASETFTITVQDTTAPTLTPIANQTKEATSAAGTAATFSASATDLVDGTDPVTFKEGNTVVHSSDTFSIGTHTLTASATDTHGNSASETFTITVQDTTAPTLTPVANQIQEATSIAGAAATFSASASDIVDGTDAVAFKEGNVVVHSGDAFSIGAHTITASATDTHGNSASETFTITVQDTTAPTLTPLADQTIEATSIVGAAATFSATATDLVDGPDAVVFKEGDTVVHSGDAFSIGTHTVTASATDLHGNTRSENFTITVQDTTPPILTPVVSQTKGATSSAGAVATFSATAIDVVDGIDQVVFKEDTAVVHSGDTFSVGTHTITASATDTRGNTSSENFTITVVQDTTAPTLTPLADQTIEAIFPGGAPATFAATATDAVDGTDPVAFTEGNLAVVSGQSFGLGTHVITASATDAAGNTSSENFTIKVVDTTPPILTPVVSQTKEATSGAGAVATFSATAIDVVDGIDQVVFNEGTAVVHSGDTFSLGTHIITASATDAAGNTSSENFTITVVQDITPPTLMPIADQTIEAIFPGGAPAIFAATATDLMDGFDPVAFKEGNLPVVSGQPFGLGTHVITASATDAAGNTSSENFTINVVDTTPPRLTPVGDQTNEATSGAGAAATFSASASDIVDGSDPVTFKEGNTVVHSGDAFSIGTHTITASATDAHGNASSETFTIKVVDTRPPTLAPVGDQTNEAASAAGAVATFSATATDTVDGTDPVVFKEGNAVVHAGDTFSVGPHVILASATDAAGNTSLEIFTINVVDTTPPTLTPIANQTVEAIFPGGAPAPFAASATDIVDGTDPVLFTEGNTGVVSGLAFGLGTHTITASATDAHGNSASETFTITVQDTTAPTLTPVANQTLEATSIAGAAATFSATATDLVDGPDAVVFKEGDTVVHSSNSFSIGTHTVTASATNSHGNTGSENFTITVQDTTPPILTPVVSQTKEATSSTGAVATFSATAIDVVDGIDQVVFKEDTAVVHSGDTFSVGTHTITASATDTHGNSASETFTVTVQDTTAPTLTPVSNQTQEATGIAGAAATFSASASDIVDGSDPVTFKQGSTVVHSGDTFGIGTHTITANATDAHGNAASETFTLTVQDTTAPTLTPVANQTQEATSAAGAAATFSASASDIVDGSDPVTFKQGNTVVHSGDTFSIGTHTITASATDAHGNAASETFTITVQDTAAPTLTPVANQTQEATSAAGAAATFSASASDIVDGTDAVAFKEGNVVVHSGDTFSLGTHTLTASATDTHGNAASETFTITVQDTTAPTLTPVANQTLQQTDPGGAVATFSASASDLVDGSDPITFKEGNTVVHSGDLFSIGSHTINAITTDAHNNSASETFSITVELSSIQFVSGGTVSSGVTVTSGHTLKVLSGGTELAASIQGGGTEDVGSGGTASGDHVASGGTFKVEAGGVASGTIVSGGGVDDVFGSQTQASINGSATIEAGGSADHLTVSNGGVLDVLAGGAANATTVQAGGSALVMSGASTSGSTIAVGGVEQVFGVASVTSVGGSQTTFSGGTEIGTRILNGGNDTIAFSGTSLSATVSSGGIQTVLAGGIASSTTVAGSAYQLVSGGTTTGTVVNGGIELLFSGAVGIGTNVFSGGQENIASGASVSGGSINGSGATLIDAGTASGITLNTGGVAYVQSGASATGTTISGNGAAEVVSGTTLSTLVLSGGLEFIASGGIASSVVVSNGGQENVGLGGIAGGATILSGGQLIEGGIARNVVLSTGAVAYIQSAASLSGVTVFRGGAEVVRPGGSTSATVLSGGGTAISGSAVSTTVGAGSVDFIASGGSASTVVVSSGGQENVGAGGTVSGVTVSSGGSLLDAGRANSVLLMSGTAAYVQAGGTASGLTVLVGAADIVSAGGVASGTVLSGGAEAVFGGVTIGTIVSGTGGVEYVAAPGTASNTVVSSGGQENVAADGTAVGTTILSGAILIDAGNVTSAAVNSGAAAYIFSGGSMTGTTVAGADIISSGGVASGTVLNRGAEVVSGGGVAVGAIVSSGGVEYVASGGVVSSAVVTSGGQENVAAGGLARGTIVSASGLLLDAGTMSGTVLSSGGAAYVQAGGVAVGTVLRGGAADVVLAGGVASGTTFSSGGTEAVFSGGVTMSALVTSGGLEYVVGGGVASAAVISGGTLEVTSGGSTGSGAVTFAVSGGGILQLDNSVHYGGLVAGFGKPDFIDFRDIAFNAATTTLSWTQVVSSGANASGTLTLADTVHSANVTLLGQYVVGNFTKQTDLHGGTLVGDPPVVAQTDTQAIGLVNPHHA